MKLLKVDNKLIALHLRSSETYTITDHIAEHTIKKITFTNLRFAILTSSKLYCLYYSQDKFKLCDLTNDINMTVNVDDIKFVTGMRAEYGSYVMGIITTSNKVYMCTILDGKYNRIKLIASLDKNVVAVSNNNLGYMYENGNGEYVEGYLNDAIHEDNIYTSTSLPTNFLHPGLLIYGNQCMIYSTSISKFILTHNNVNICYNRYYYCSEDNLVRRFNDKQQLNYGYHVTDYHTMIDYDDKHKIILVNKTGMINYIVTSNGNTATHQIAQSYYHVENLSQYSNNTWNIGWTINNHQSFGKYASKFVKNILTCHKYGKLQKWIPKGVLYLILQFVL